MKGIVITIVLMLGMGTMGFGQVTPIEKQTKKKDTIRITKDTLINANGVVDSLLIIDISKVKHLKLDIAIIKKPEKSEFEKLFDRLSLRKSFQLVKDKAEDAFVNLVYPKDSASSQNFSFALGANVLSYKGGTTLMPFIEWQKNTLVAKKQNVFITGLNLRAPLWPLKKWTLFLISTANYKHDVIKETEGTQVSAYFTPVFDGRNNRFFFLPDALMKNGLLSITYNFYAGLEFEDRSKVEVAEHKGKVWRGYLRLTSTIRPLPDILDDRLEIVPDYTYRNSFSRETSVEEAVNKLWKLSFNLVVIKKKKSKIADVKIGFDHVNGTDPTSGFEKQKLNTVSLKVKI